MKFEAIPTQPNRNGKEEPVDTSWIDLAEGKLNEVPTEVVAEKVTLSEEHPSERMDSEIKLKPIPSVGSAIGLIKKEIIAGAHSVVKHGEGVSGRLLAPIFVGEPILLDSGSRTSRVKNTEQTATSVIITTETSVYELHKLFDGTNIDSPMGKVSLPRDARPSQLKPGSAREMRNRNSKNGEIIQVKIDRDKLKDILIQTGGKVVHIVDAKRYMILARVGNAHIPFYRSSNGTDGKKQGEWYPFFGHTGKWLIKGDVVDDGSMHYSPEITAVQDILNENLILPSASYLNRDFQLTLSNGAVAYDIGQEIPMGSVMGSQEYQDNKDIDIASAAYIKRLSGYDPRALDGYHPKNKNPEKSRMPLEWIEKILKEI
jgi:hypothetical protein